MGFFSRAKKQAIAVVQKKFGGYYSQVIHIPPTMGTMDYLRSYGQIGWLFACVSKISQNVGDSEWKAYKGETATENSLALKLLQHPNKYMSQYDMLVKISGFLDLTGKCFLYFAKNGMGQPTEIWVINPMDMWIVPDKEDFVKGYIYRAGAEQIPLEKDEVIFFSLPDFANPYGGVGPAQASANSLESDKYASQWNRNFFYNNADPQGILSLPDVGDDDYNRLREEWNDRHRGVENAKRTAIVRGEGVSYTPIQINQKDMDFYNLKNQNRDEILGAFGVHKSILGLTDDVSRANAETAEYVFQSHVIKPRLRMIQDKFNNEYLPMFREEGLLLKFTDPVPDNKDFINTILDTQVNKTLTINEGRDIVNKLLGLQLKPVSNGDVIYQQTTLQPLGTKPPAAPSTPSNSVNDLGSEVPTPEEGKLILAGKESPTLYNSLDRQTRKKVAKQINKNNSSRHADFIELGEPLIKDFENTMSKYFKSQLADVAELIKGGSKDPVNLLDWDTKLQKLVSPIYAKAFQAAGRSVVQEFKGIGNYIKKDTGIIFDFKAPEVHKPLELRSAR